MRAGALVLCLLAGCGAPAAPVSPPDSVAPRGASDVPATAHRPRRARATSGVTTVLLVDAPGPLVDGNAPPPLPGTPPVTHAALQGSCTGEPGDCSVAGRIVRGATSFDEAVDGLRELGYDVAIEPG